MPEVREVLHRSAASPFDLPDAELLWQRVQRRRTRRRSRRVMVVLAVVGIAAGVLVWVVRPADRAERVVTGQPGPDPATALQLTGPQGVAVDHSGDVYLTDTNQVFRVDRSGLVTVLAGTAKAGFSGDGGRASAATLSQPSAIAIGSDGQIYVLDLGNDRVREITRSGLIRTVAGSGRAGFAGDDGPAVDAALNLGGGGNFASGLALGGSGDLYIADGGNRRVRRVDRASGRIRTVAGDGHPGVSGDGGQATDASIDTPTAVAVDAAGDLAIAGGGVLREVSASTGRIRSLTTAATSGPLASGGSQPYGMTFDRSGRLYISTGYGRQIVSFDPTTRQATIVAGTGEQTVPSSPQAANAGDGGPATAATLGLALGVTIGPDQSVYIADFFNNSIRRIDHQTGNITTVVGHHPTSIYDPYNHCC